MNVPLTSAGANGLRRVGVVVNKYNRPFVSAIAAELRQRTGCEIVAYVQTEAERRGFERLRQQPWDRVVAYDVFRGALEMAIGDPDAVVTRARNFEALIGEPYHYLSMDRRQPGRGFSPGGARFPRDPVVAGASYHQILHAFSEQLAFWQSQIEHAGIGLFIDAPKEAAVIARAFNVPWRFLTFARLGNRYYWSTDEYRRNLKLEARFKAIRESEDAAIERPYAAAATKMAMSHANARWSGAMRSIAKGVFGWSKHVVTRRSRMNRTSLWRVLEGPVRRSRDYSLYSSLAAGADARLSKSEFVYFPLQKEPETAWLVTTPEYTSQHAAVIAVASALPAGVLLAVKENITALGRRPAEFYRQLTDLKNVVLVPFEESSLALQQAAVLTACLTGTAAFEAAAAGKPVMVFGRWAQHGFLDHVEVVTDHAQIRPFVTRVLSGRVDHEAARRNGRRLLQAMRETTFDLGPFVLEADFDEARLKDKVSAAVDALLESLSPQATQEIAPPRAYAVSGG